MYSTHYIKVYELQHEHNSAFPNVYHSKLLTFSHLFCSRDFAFNYTTDGHHTAIYIKFHRVLPGTLV